MSNFRLKLYVMGSTNRSVQAEANVRDICEELLPGQYELTIVDVVAQPQLAEQNRILATPTLVKELPPPTRILIGDFSDKEKVCHGLGLPSPQPLAQ